MSTHIHEHQYIIKDITLVSHDGTEYSLISQFVNFTYQESIFETTIHSSIFVVESVDYPTKLPMIGEERLRISFTRLDETSGDEIDPIKFDLPIYSLSGKTQEGKSLKRQTYTLYCCSDVIYKNLNSVVSKSFKNMPYSQMVQAIYDTFLKIDKPLEVEQTEGLKDYVVQNQHPLKSIFKICKRSASAEGNGLFYVFFEDRDKFNFVTMKKLMQQSPKRTIYYGVKNLPVAGTVPMKNLALDMYSASSLNESAAGFDVLKSALSGETSSSILTVDPIRRTYEFKTLDLRGPSEKSSIEKTVGSPAPLEFAEGSDLSAITNKDAPETWTKKSKLFINPRSVMKVVIGDSGQDTQEYISQRDPTVKPYNPELFCIQREAEKLQFIKNTIVVSLPGDPRIKAGDVITFKLPEKTGYVNEGNPQQLDRYLQGNYIVVAVTHIVSKTKYSMKLELMKNTYHGDIKPVNLFQER